MEGIKQLVDAIESYPAPHYGRPGEVGGSAPRGDGRDSEREETVKAVQDADRSIQYILLFGRRPRQTAKWRLSWYEGKLDDMSKETIAAKEKAKSTQTKKALSEIDNAIGRMGTVSRIGRQSVQKKALWYESQLEQLSKEIRAYNETGKVFWREDR